MSKIILIILLILIPKSTYSESITLSFIASLNLLEAKLIVLQTLTQTSEMRIIKLEKNLLGLGNDLWAALSSAQSSEKIIERQAKSLESLSVSLEKSEKLTQEIEASQELIIKGFEKEINQWQMLFFGLAGGALGGLVGYFSGDLPGGLIGAGAGGGVGVVLALIF